MSNGPRDKCVGSLEGMQQEERGLEGRGKILRRLYWARQAGWCVQPVEICLAKAHCLLSVEGLELWGCWFGFSGPHQEGFLTSSLATLP